jgi:hypothetical protein
MKTIQTDARKRIQKAVDLLDQVVAVLGDGDDLERALAGVPSGMVESPGHAKQATFLAFDARLRLKDALEYQPGKE